MRVFFSVVAPVIVGFVVQMIIPPVGAVPKDPRMNPGAGSGEDKVE